MTILFAFEEALGFGPGDVVFEKVRRWFGGESHVVSLFGAHGNGGGGS